jgi:hypothetical protein
MDKREITRLAVLVGLGLLMLGLAGCAATKADTSVANSLKVVKTTAHINVDGRGDDTAWRTAPEVVVKVAGEAGVAARDIRLRAVRDDTNIYLLARYADKSPLKANKAWAFDGQSWSEGSFDDSLSLVWNINNSIKGFNTKGFGVMTTPLKRGADIFDFRLAGPAEQLRAESADYWGW